LAISLSHPDPWTWCDPPCVREQGVAMRVLAVHAAGQREASKGASGATVEQALGLLTALGLRYPEGAAAAADAGGLEAAMEVRPTVEQALGLLTALCLRYPEGAAAAADAGCLEAAMEVRLSEGERG
jgi:hypothetical protein